MSATRLPLSRDRILERAVQIADADGVEALTMRRLGEELGFEAMSLYRHVKNKDDVLGGILDAVLAEIESPARVGRAGWWSSSRRRASGSGTRPFAGVRSPSTTSSAVTPGRPTC